MGNKLSRKKVKRKSNRGKEVSKKESKRKFKLGKKFYVILLVVLIIVFIYVCTDIFLTSSEFSKELDSMIEGKDYYVEEVTITGKDYDSYFSTPDTSVETKNYFFYYDFIMEKKMFVDEDTYKKYNIGDKVLAYTTDHSNYGFTKESILPTIEYKNNELKKCIGVVLGVSILLLRFWMWINSKYSYS